MIKQSLITVAILGFMTMTTSAYDEFFESDDTIVNKLGCTGCHGTNFEKRAMGMSKIVKDMSKKDILIALKGYKDGTYGGVMKGIMKGIASKLSDKDIEAITTDIKK